MKMPQHLESNGSGIGKYFSPRLANVSGNAGAALQYPGPGQLPAKYARQVTIYSGTWFSANGHTTEKNAPGDRISRYARASSAGTLVNLARLDQAGRDLDTMAGTQARVYVFDADVCVRETIESLARLAGWHCEQFQCAEEFLSRPRVMEQACLVLELDLPGLSGLDLQRRLVRDYPGMPVVFLSDDADVPTAVQAMKEGAVDFLTKPLDRELLLNALGSAVEQSRTMFDDARITQSLRDRHASLSCREHQVMALVVAGLLNKQIGFELGISEITVKAHRGQVMRKMGAGSLAGLVAMAGRLGLVPMR